MDSSNAPENEVQYIDREHTWGRYVFISVGLSLCIFVDIFQYSMPLAFLPSVLEDRGHSPMKIATAIGVYYWTGFLGGLVITSYQIWRVLYMDEKDNHHEVTPFATVRRHLKLLIGFLLLATLTLFVQALHPRWSVHTACRFVQGFLGAYIFFYAFLLCVAVFKGQQQVTAMTLASCAVVLAEVFGSFVGAVLYDLYGQGAVFWFLGLVSFAIQGYLVAILCIIRPTDEPMPSPPSRHRSPPRSPMPSSPMLSMQNADVAAGEPSGQIESSWVSRLRPQPAAVKGMKALMQSRQFACANLLITMAAVIKGSVEEMLPFHGDHQWGYDPLQIGQLFCTVAIAYMLAAALVNQFWMQIDRMQIGCSSCWLSMLGVSAWMAFAVANYHKDPKLLTATLAMYGFCAGLTFTAASQLIADVIDHEEGPFKEAANGIWNATWEAGGSLGFFLGGLLAERYNDQLTLLTRYVIGAFVTAICMIGVAFWPAPAESSGKGSKLTAMSETKFGYGTVA